MSYRDLIAVSIALELKE